MGALRTVGSWSLGDPFLSSDIAEGLPSIFRARTRRALMCPTVGIHESQPVLPARVLNPLALSIHSFRARFELYSCAYKTPAGTVSLINLRWCFHRRPPHLSRMRWWLFFITGFTTTGNHSRLVRFRLDGYGPCQGVFDRLIRPIKPYAFALD